MTDQARGLASSWLVNAIHCLLAPARVEIEVVERRCAQLRVHSPGERRSNTPVPLFQWCQDYGASTRTESTAATITRVGRINTLPAINSRISRPPFLNSPLLDPAQSTLDASKRSKIACGTFGGTPGRQAKGRNGRVSGDAVKILRLPKYSADGLARKQRGGFTGCTFWRCGVEDSRTTSKNTEPSHLTPGSLREYANQSECERKPILPRPHRVNKPAVR